MLRTSTLDDWGEGAKVVGLLPSEIKLAKVFIDRETQKNLEGTWDCVLLLGKGYVLWSFTARIG